MSEPTCVPSSTPVTQGATYGFSVGPNGMAVSATSFSQKPQKIILSWEVNGTETSQGLTGVGVGVQMTTPQGAQGVMIPDNATNASALFQFAEVSTPSSFKNVTAMKIAQMNGAQQTNVGTEDGSDGDYNDTCAVFAVPNTPE